MKPLQALRNFGKPKARYSLAQLLVFIVLMGWCASFLAQQSGRGPIYANTAKGYEARELILKQWIQQDMANPRSKYG